MFVSVNNLGVPPTRLPDSTATEVEDEDCPCCLIFKNLQMKTERSSKRKANPRPPPSPGKDKSLFDKYVNVNLTFLIHKCSAVIRNLNHCKIVKSKSQQ